MLRWIVAAVVVVCAQPALSQNWYQVEIIIFSQSDPDAYSPGATAESWPDTLNPEWPAPLVRLNASGSPSPALRTLPVAARQMNNDSYALRVTEGYELLWHQAWQQPMLAEAHAPWIQIQAGSEYGGRSQLEGALRIYLERFLHLDTDLWLSDFSQAQALENSEPEDATSAFTLPNEVLSTPACVFFRENWPNDVRMEVPDIEPGNLVENWWFPPFDCGNEAIDLPAGLPIARALDPYIRVELPSIRFTPANNFGAGPSQEQEVKPLFVENSPLPSEPLEATPDSLPAISQIIPMHQSRRMRSGELHYLDHPRLGVLALITPIEAPVIDPDAELTP